MGRGPRKFNDLGIGPACAFHEHMPTSVNQLAQHADSRKGVVRTVWEENTDVRASIRRTDEGGLESIARFSGCGAVRLRREWPSQRPRGLNFEGCVKP